MKEKSTKHNNQCPNCGERAVLPILYGLPTEEAGRAAQRGEFVLGGCCIDKDSPNRHCSKCGHQWKSSRKHV